MSSKELRPINIDEPRWDQNTYIGRAKFYFATVNPRNIFYSSKSLDEAKNVIDTYRKTRELPAGVSVEQLYRLKDIYDSAFHPETGQKITPIGRMSAQVPMNMLITGCMMTFYRTNPAVVFWQWVNQSFNAVVNYSNRSGAANVTQTQLGVAYACATTGAVVTALGTKSLIQGRSLLARFVPFFGVVAANCVNIPIMRYHELRDGISVYTENNTLLGKSKIAARNAIAAVVFSRIVMAFPSMSLTPVVMHRLERRPFLRKNPVLLGPVSILLTGFVLLFATPLACAIFSQKVWVPIQQLEPHLKEGTDPNVGRVYYNKGL
ncbi:LOW QUALITY PROTEIN: sideroflexin-1 [Bemisia tabaci]|uniref:LOW QUALITY PROTEIN: sideroflexin-1 n=1 Tax=Bemisia tabaci TaxID=7038 RepID=UPI003B28D3CA